jgi:hypothetical protein
MKKPLLGLSAFSAVLIYCALLVAGNFFIYQQQKETLYSEFENTQATELKLLAELARESLVSQNYAMIEWFFKKWGVEYTKVVLLSLENNQGFSLIKYQRAVPAQAEMLVSSKRIKLYDDIYQLEISSDTVELSTKLSELLLQLLLISVGAIILLVIMLWFVMQKFAIQPLAQEVKRRQRAEYKLQAFEADN